MVYFNFVIYGRLLLRVNQRSLVDAHGNADLRFKGLSSSPLTYLPDWLCVPTQQTKRVYARLGCSSDRIIVCGHPHWNFVIKTARQLENSDREAIRRRIFSGLGNDRSVVVFISEGCARLKPRDANYFDVCTIPVNRMATGRTEIVLDLFLNEVERIIPRPYLVFREHPKDIETDYEAYRKRFDCICRHTAVEVLFAADYIVGMTSSLMMEAALMDKPTLAIVPRGDETVILPAIEMGLTPWVATAAHLREILPHFLTGAAWSSSADLPQMIPEDALQVISDLIIKRLNKND